MASYSTSFPGTENPVSESGAWIKRGLAEGLDWTDPATDGTGICYGTQAVGSPVVDDSVGHLGGFSNDHQITVTFKNDQSFGTADIEVEAHLRCTITAHSIISYELSWQNNGAGKASLYLVQWQGARGSFIFLPNPPGTATPLFTNVDISTGATGGAKIVGSLITLYSNGSVLGTYDTSTDAAPITTGNPGMGFWDAGSDTDAHRKAYCITQYTAADIGGASANRIFFPAQTSGMGVGGKLGGNRIS